MAQIEDRIKAWLTPGLISIFGVITWSLVTEIRSDVKALLSANARTEVRLDNLEKRMDKIELFNAQKVYATKPEEIQIKRR